MRIGLSEPLSPPEGREPPCAASQGTGLSLFNAVLAGIAHGAVSGMADVAMPDGRAMRPSAQAAGSWTTILRGCYRELARRVAGGRRLEIQI